MDQLFERFVPDAAPHAIRSSRQLVQEARFQGQLIAVSGIGADNWARWRTFLSDYEDAARAIEVFDRTQFCVFCEGQPALEPPPEGVCLEIRYWENVVDELDLQLFAADLSRDIGGQPLQRALWVETVTKLAMWDPTVILAFANRDLGEVYTPRDVLQEIARARRWQAPFPEPPAERWAQGLGASHRDRGELHLAALAVGGDTRSIERKLWAAQLRVLFPVLEERRQELLVSLDGQLSVPFTSQGGALIEDVCDLELGHIEYQLHVSRRFRGTRVLQRITLCKDIRNHLAHLEPVPPETLRAAMACGALESTTA